jgi:hypothetical protein
MEQMCKRRYWRIIELIVKANVKLGQKNEIVSLGFAGY